LLKRIKKRICCPLEPFGHLFFGKAKRPHATQVSLGIPSGRILRVKLLKFGGSFRSDVLFGVSVTT
jgi:hypothetical protein